MVNASGRRRNRCSGRGEADEVVGQAREVRLELGAGERELGREVAVAHRVERVLGDALEAEVAGQRLAVQGQGGAGQRARAQRQHVHAPPRVCQPLAVAHQRPGVRAQEMAERDGLRRAHVRVAGHDGAGARLAVTCQRLHQRRRLLAQLVDGAAGPQAQRRDRLLVAAAAQVHLPGQVAHDLAQPLLHEAVHVLGVDLQVEGIRHRVVEHLGQALVERGRVLGAEHAAAVQCLHVRA